MSRSGCFSIPIQRNERKNQAKTNISIQPNDQQDKTTNKEETQMSNNTANATYNLGRVGMNLRGEYDPAAAYEPLDTVTWRGGSYAARVAATGIAPSAEDTWMPLAQGLAPYSAEEQKTGSRWIDGRPIYRRAFDVTRNLPSGTVLFAINDMDALLTCSGCIVESNGAKRPFGSAYSSNNEYGVYVLNNNNLIVQTLGGGVGARAYGYVEYTKTTDAPTYYYLPYLALASDQNCVISASSEFSSGYYTVYAFGGSINGRYWACAEACRSVRSLFSEVCCCRP